MGSITNILLLVFFINFSQSKKALVDSSCLRSEWKALLELKAGLSDDSSSLSSWTGRDCCSWDGISCHNLTGHVQTLQLDDFDFNITGCVKVFHPKNGTYRGFNSSLSPWLFNLTHLHNLTISNFRLRGSIPNMFEKLTSLAYVDLSGNFFDYAMFPDSLCSLTSLTHMDLMISGLRVSMPSCLANLTSLSQLNLGANGLRGEIPGWLCNLTHLTHLNLVFNHFNSSIPSCLGNLQQLEYLCLQHNRLSGSIPSILGNLTKLRSLQVSDNFLTGKLSELFFDGLKSLDKLDISRNYDLVFSVSPEWIPHFQMSSIIMDSVLIGTQFPPWLQTQRNLEELTMKNVSIFGSIPDWFLTASPDLNYLDLSNNLLTGSIPDQCQTAFPNLFSLDLSKNSFTGSVPGFNSASLEYLLLSRNQFGNIPQQLCNLTSLKYLSLGNNQLIGTIPSCLGTLRKLLVLNLGNNSLSGHIPNEFGSMTSLLSLHMNGNKLSGELSALQNMTLLVTLDLGDNELHGSIPKWIGKNWSHLQYLRLESNNFSGEISVNICQLPSLQIMNLALNNLVGTIPPCFGNLIKISEESGETTNFFSYDEVLLNIIKGHEMEYTSNLPYAKFISLSGNNLHGEIPTEFMNLKGLQSLNLSNNELTGMIPETINNLKHLESLDLSMNRISGSIPQSLADIDALGYLNLSFNCLAGRIPSGNHFDTLDDPSIYQGNEELCGKPLMKSCSGDNSDISNQPNGSNSNGDDELDRLSWMFAGIGPGFAVGFLAVICSLYFKYPWRIAYFAFADYVYMKVRGN